MLTALLGMLLLCAGCGDKTPRINGDQVKAFDGAPAEVKQVWEKALAADKANDYVTAAVALDNLNKMTLSEQQVQALNVEREAFGLRLMKAVDKNDPAAIKAVQSSKKSRNR